MRYDLNLSPLAEEKADELQGGNQDRRYDRGEERPKGAERKCVVDQQTEYSELCRPDEAKYERAPTRGAQFLNRHPAIALRDRGSDANHCYRGKTAAPSPDKWSRQSGREEQKSDQAEPECENGLR